MKKKLRLICTVIGSIVVLSVVGALMVDKIDDLMTDYMETQVASQAKLLSETATAKFSAELEKLEGVAQTSEAVAALVVDAKEKDGISMGMLALQGEAVYGEPLAFSDFQGILDAFRGNPSISYNRSYGLLFTVPVYHGENVKYVLYELYETRILADSFGTPCFEGQGTYLIRNREDEIIVPQVGNVPVEVLMETEYTADCWGKIKEGLNISTSAAAYNSYNRQFLFLAEVQKTDFLLIGAVPNEAVVSEGISYIIRLMLWVFGLLFVLFIIGVVYLFSAEEKARESDELREAKQLAENASRAKSDFLANMSHEIRTPINSVMGMNEMILRECRDEEIQTYARNIQSASKTLLSLINDILDFSKIESGKMEIVDVEYSLGRLLNDVTNMVTMKAKEKALKFEVKVDGKLPRLLFGDEVRIRQIMVNILNNAVKYTKKGSVIFQVDQEAVEGELLQLKISVKDTGIGIRKEDIDKLFIDFERVDIKDNRNIEGTGLGLAITKKLVEKMNGTIRVESEFGVGSVFTVILPQVIRSHEAIGDFVQDAKNSQDVEYYHQSLLAPKASVLVVDDNEMNLFVVKNLLKQTKIQITECMSGTEALQWMEKKHFDVVLLDHMMPGMDGVETLHRVKEETTPCDTSVFVALTANAIAGVREMYLKEGFDDYLSKPINIIELEELLNKHLPEELKEAVGQVISQEDVSKLEEASKTQEAPKTKEPQEGIVQEEDCINVSLGKSYCGGDTEMYQALLKLFVEMAPEKRAEIVSSYEASDWHNYAIYVHALKSNALGLGAKTLSEQALALEQAGKQYQNGEEAEVALSYIHANHENLLQLYDRTIEEAKRVLG